MLNGLLQRVVNNLVRNCLIDESYLWPPLYPLVFSQLNLRLDSAAVLMPQNNETTAMLGFLWELNSFPM